MRNFLIITIFLISGLFAFANNLNEQSNLKMLDDLEYINNNIFNDFENEKSNISEMKYTVESCFSFYHRLYTAWYGGINLDNVEDFNSEVSECQSILER